MEQWVGMISTVGFPIAVAWFLLYELKPVLTSIRDLLIKIDTKLDVDYGGNNHAD